ncbi:MAG TPA: hypothetical protein VM737_01545, partial [Gemmatimonadota bacterium]|nr:hypothetical protein [Gemmatimonadota bacterium]
ITQSGTLAWAIILVEVLALVGIRQMGAQRRLRLKAERERQEIRDRLAGGRYVAPATPLMWADGGEESRGSALMPRGTKT